MALTLALSTGANVFAAPSNSDSLTEVKQQKQDLEIKVEKLNNDIGQVMQQIDDNKKDIDNVTDNIKATQSNIESTEKNLENQQQLFNKRVKAMYINGSNSYLGVVLNANNLNDFLSRLDNVKKVMGFDKNVISGLTTKKEQLSAQKQNLDQENEKLSVLKSDNEEKLSKLNSDKDSENTLIKSLDAKEKELAVADTETSKMIASAANNVQEIRKAAPRITGSISRGGSETATSNAVVAYASNFLNVPYVWGGTSPSGFDCSGLVQYVYAHFGIDLPRTSQAQQNVGVAVSRSELQPGDLVFFGSPAYHVGIYVGNGSFINAPKTGDVVKIASLDNRSDFTGGRRVM
jgi:cell wall-associated NlpC family hydrolase/chaperonin cofactor prefoldin